MLYLFLDDEQYLHLMSEQTMRNITQGIIAHFSKQKQNKTLCERMYMYTIKFEFNSKTSLVKHPCSIAVVSI